MIPCFPDPHPDEIFYSLCARYSSHVCYTSTKKIFQELFGSQHSISAIGLPTHLGHVIDNLPPERKYTVDDLIDQNTLFPLYGPFLSQERWLEIRELMIGDNGTGIYRRLGLANQNIPRLTFFRYCPDCAEQDKKNFGEYYWHRLHQVVGVEICPIHGNFLENSTAQLETHWTRSALVSANDAIEIRKPRKAASSPWYQTLFDIATDVLYLLEHPCISQGLPFLYKTYHSLLAVQDLVTPYGLVRSSDLMDRFASCYSAELLLMLHCEITRNTNNWLFRLLRPSKRVQHPLHHILTMHALNSNIDAFFHKPIKSPSPFGEGPWPCLNPVCEFYKKMCISDYQIRKGTEKGYISATFVCVCGFKYSRVGPDSSPEDIFRRDRIYSYGSIWEKKLSELWPDQDLSLSTISRLLSVSPDLLNRQAAKLGLSVPRNPLQESKKRLSRKRKNQKDVTWYRDQWLAILQEAPDASISALFRKCPKIFEWLRDNDRVWFLEHRPAVRKKSVPQIFQSTQFSSKARANEYDIDYDRTTAKAVRDSASKIGAICPPQRVTIHSIQRDTPQTRVRSKLTKLPLTAQAFQEVQESRESFLIRRIWWIVQKYQEKRVCPTRSQLISEVRAQDFLDVPVVQRNLDEAMNVLLAFT